MPCTCRTGFHRVFGPCKGRPFGHSARKARKARMVKPIAGDVDGPPCTVPCKDTAFGPCTVHVAMAAPVACGGFPLAVIPHGSGSSARVLRTLVLALAVLCPVRVPVLLRVSGAVTG